MILLTQPNRIINVDLEFLLVRFDNLYAYYNNSEES